MVTLSRSLEPVHLVKNPSTAEAASLLQDAFPRHLVTLVIGHCRANYEGRASSTLNWGDRILVVKADGSLLVHRPWGYEPVNWQPPGCILQAGVTPERELKLRATRLQPREVIEVFFDRVYLVVVSTLTDEGEFSLHVSELDAKRAILHEPSIIEEGFSPLSEEKSLGESGFVDIFGEDRQKNFVVVELKRVPAGKEAVLQLGRYMEAIRERMNRPVRGIIAAPGLSKEAQLLLERLGLEYREISLHRCYEILRLSKARKIDDFIGKD
ncbi:MAG: endonuclease NucS [Candidatus Bathyarchaeia archaeon]